MEKKKRVLIAPLDWGIGHATRDIPIIRELIKQGAEVVIAADNRPYELLKKEFPQLEFHRLPGYAITYQKKGSFALTVFMQVPKMFKSGFAENKWISKAVDELKIDAVISDNRYGLYTKKVPCIFMTHQIVIIMPTIFKWSEYITYLTNNRIMKNYAEIWIPDFEGEKNLSGALAHKYKKPKNAICIGPLTRFKNDTSLKKVYDILVIMSGPEPQRTLMEEMMIEQLKDLPMKSLIVRGVPEEEHSFKKISDNLETISFMTADELNKTTIQSEIIISRSGYSTIMDIAVLGKKAIFIPTPGQTEQEHLAWEFRKKKIYFAEHQHKFDIKKALEVINEYSGLDIKEDLDSVIEDRVKNLLSLIK